MEAESKNIFQEDPQISQVYLSGLLSRHFEEYDPEDRATHPSFHENVEALTMDQISSLFQILEDHISILDRQTTAQRKQIDWDKTWGVKEAKIYSEYQKLRSDLERLWHLKIDLQKLIDTRMTRFLVHSAKNLNFGAEDLILLSRLFGNDVVAILGAGWWEGKESGEA